MIDFDSQYSVAWCSLASSAEAAGNLTEAESHYQRAISLYPPARLPRLLYVSTQPDSTEATTELLLSG